jgi:hypothetical protein
MSELFKPVGNDHPSNHLEPVVLEQLERNMQRAADESREWDPVEEMATAFALSAAVSAKRTADKADGMLLALGIIAVLLTLIFVEIIVVMVVR